MPFIKFNKNERKKILIRIACVALAAIAWIIMAVTALFIWIVATKCGWSRSVTGALLLIVPLGNTGFVGFPLIEALLGQEALPYAILYDQFGSFFALNTYGSIVAAYYSGGVTSWRNLIRVVVSFPPFIALVISFATFFVVYPDWLSHALQRISSTLVPVVMVAVGLQWQLRLDKNALIPLGVALLTALILMPLLALSLLKIFEIDGIVAHTIILQAAMPAMISAGVLAINYQLAPRLSSSIVGYSLLLSLVTVWAWRQII
ncbi:MAG: AEC family transporter [Moraxellaceae bacterium]|nr:MAG: AEC family transporter [Moraxellaceae bacterium]